MTTRFLLLIASFICLTTTSCTNDDEEPLCQNLDELSHEVMVFGDCGDDIDNDEDGSIDCEDVDCEDDPACDESKNLPPTMPQPEIPREGGPNHSVSTEMPMVCVLSDPAEDPEGDLIYYRFNWVVDGEPSEHTGGEVSNEDTVVGQEWTCYITAFDGHSEGPAGSTTALIGGNHPPTQPVVEITPSSPTVDQNLDCTILFPSTDADGDDVTYFFRWTRDGILMEIEGSEVFAAETQSGEEWTCVVTPTDSVSEGKSGTASVIIN